MTIYIVDLESISTRYTCQWKQYLPQLFKDQGLDTVVIEGPGDLPNQPTPGMFLNFSATNIYKSVQTEKISQLFLDNQITDGDYFLFTDAWHPGIINVRYMADLLGIKIKMGGLWHAGSYDPWDGLGQLIGNRPWVRHAEKSMFHALDHNYFATHFHIDMFCENLLFNDAQAEITDFSAQHLLDSKKIIRAGWPMDYLAQELAAYQGATKRDLVVFPHRIAPEKQLDIFLDLKKNMPNVEFVVCQDQPLTKHQYHTLLSEAKVVFSANLQETLGISWYEGALVGATPLVPSRLSYKEMALAPFRYPSIWTESFDAYLLHRAELIELLTYHINNYTEFLPSLNNQVRKLKNQYFSGDQIVEQIKQGN